EAVRVGRMPDGLWPKLRGNVAWGRRVCRQDPERQQTRRSTRRAANYLRACHQRTDSQIPRTHDPAAALAASGSGARVIRGRLPNIPLQRTGGSRCSLPAAERGRWAADDPQRRRTMNLRRIAFLFLIVLLAPVLAEPQAPTKIAKIGWMSGGNPTVTDP